MQQNLCYFAKSARVRGSFPYEVSFLSALYCSSHLVRDRRAKSRTLMATECSSLLECNENPVLSGLLHATASRCTPSTISARISHLPILITSHLRPLSLSPFLPVTVSHISPGRLTPHALRSWLLVPGSYINSLD